MAKHMVKRMEVYLGLSILEISKILMCELWYDYLKLKYKETIKLCYMNTAIFIVCIKTEGIYVDIGKDFKKIFHTWNCDSERLLSRVKKVKKVIALMKDELDVKILIESVALRPKTCRYLTDNNVKNNKAKGSLL